jgi:hypothetical protein
MIRLMLFGTSGCHLCEQAESVINDCLRDGLELIIEDIDIAEQDQWQDRYAIRIPVLYHPETRQELGWPFDQSDVKEFINSLAV